MGEPPGKRGRAADPGGDGSGGDPDSGSAYAGVDAEDDGDRNPFLIDGPYGEYDPRPGAYGDDDPGGGPYDPETGIRDWYGNSDATDATPDPEPQKVGWDTILDHWASVEADLHTVFNVDCESDILHRRTWRWLRVRINDLIDQPSRLRTALGITTHTRS